MCVAGLDARVVSAGMFRPKFPRFSPKPIIAISGQDFSDRECLLRAALVRRRDHQREPTGLRSANTTAVVIGSKTMEVRARRLRRAIDPSIPECDPASRGRRLLPS